MNKQGTAPMTQQGEKERVEMPTRAAEEIINAALSATRSMALLRVHSDDLAVVVNVVWTAPSGNQFAFGSAIPDDAPPILVDSLRKSAEEAEPEICGICGSAIVGGEDSSCKECDELGANAVLAAAKEKPSE